MRKILIVFISISVFACISIPTVPGDNTTVPTNGIPFPTQTQMVSLPTAEVQMKFEITSPAFSNGASIPLKYSCKGSDITPALRWADPPYGALSFALIMDDPDAPMGTWVHWVIFNIPASARGLQEATPTDAKLNDGSLQGITSAGRHGYHGPCPPSGTHRYFFKLYALDMVLSLSTNADKTKLLAAMQGHILANAELMGTFSK
jgi:Raf kinase inhibitor-like YbhB/YbcL family protein